MESEGGKRKEQRRKRGGGEMAGVCGERTAEVCRNGRSYKTTKPGTNWIELARFSEYKDLLLIKNNNHLDLLCHCTFMLLL